MVVLLGLDRAENLNDGSARFIAVQVYDHCGSSVAECDDASRRVRGRDGEQRLKHDRIDPRAVWLALHQTQRAHGGHALEAAFALPHF